MSFIGFCLLMFVIIIIGCCIGSGDKGSRPSYYTGGYVPDPDEDQIEDYADYETNAVWGDRDYFSDDPSQNYDSYYAQVADDAMMGDEGAIEEMMGEF